MRFIAVFLTLCGAFQLQSSVVSETQRRILHQSPPLDPPAATPSDDKNWQDGFVLPAGVDGEVFAIAAIGNDLYVGGRFVKAGDLVVNSIARWDGTNWSAIGSGIGSKGGSIFALAKFGSQQIGRASCRERV